MYFVFTAACEGLKEAASRYEVRLTSEGKKKRVNSRWTTLFQCLQSLIRLLISFSLFFTPIKQAWESQSTAGQKCEEFLHLSQFCRIKWHQLSIINVNFFHSKCQKQAVKFFANFFLFFFLRLKGVNRCGFSWLVLQVRL